MRFKEFYLHSDGWVSEEEKNLFFRTIYEEKDSSGKSKKDKIIDLLKQNKSVKDVAKLVGTHQVYVYSIAKTLNLKHNVAAPPKQIIKHVEIKKAEEPKSELQKQTGIDYEKAVPYILKMTKEQAKSLEKIVSYIENPIELAKLSNEDIDFLTNIPGLPKRIGENIYRGIMFTSQMDEKYKQNINNYKDAFNTEKDIIYILPERNFASWSLKQNIAIHFARAYPSTQKKISVILKTEITENSTYIDIDAISKIVKQAKAGHDELNKYNLNNIDLYNEEQEILYVCEKQTSKVIYFKSNIDEE
jgi:hypothetical protein